MRFFPFVFSFLFFLVFYFYFFRDLLFSSVCFSIDYSIDVVTSTLLYCEVAYNVKRGMLSLAESTKITSKTKPYMQASGLPTHKDPVCRN